MINCLFFFFKQKTAYEMRISDWSSDVCSSDLPRRGQGRAVVAAAGGQSRGRRGLTACGAVAAARRRRDLAGEAGRDCAARPPATVARRGIDRPAQARSEEHTSELQSLMRISYAVFSLKKQNKTTRRTTMKHQSISKH